MPVRRRVSKQKIGPAAELAAWSELFSTGYDFFGDLDVLGFEGSGDADRAARVAAEEAWARLGEMFMATWELDHPTEPWALQQWGKPWEKPRARKA